MEYKNKAKEKEHNSRRLIDPEKWLVVTKGETVELEGIMLSEISQTEKDKYQMISLIYGV